MSVLMNLYFVIFFFQEPDEGVVGPWMAAQMNDLIIEGMRTLATSFWFVEKIAAGITRFLTEEDMWELVLDSTINSLASTMPDILSTLIFSGGGGSGGLIYLALMMAGLLMIIPGVSHLKLVSPTRVISWGMVVSVLFLSATPWGYDLIGLVEQMRAGAVAVVIETVAEEGDLDALVAQPMMAEESDVEDYNFVLPEEFSEEYYPEPEEDDYEERTLTVFAWSTTFQVETEESQNERREAGEMGLAISGLTLMPGVVLLMFGLIFATLTASALILIIFFLVALPLGFFEFGGAILNGIVKQYAYLWAITLLAVILPGILVAAETLAYPSGDAPDPSQMMGFIPVLVVVTIATSYVSAMATSALTDTFSIVSTSISTAMAPMNAGGRMPQGGMLEGGLASGANVAATAALAAVTGGASAALMAGAGSLLSQGSDSGGKAAGGLAAGLMGAERASVFSTAARGAGPGAVSRAAGLQSRTRRRRQKTESEKLKKSVARTPVPELKSGPVQMGAYTTFDGTRLGHAENAFREGKTETARAHLMKIFGESETTEAVLASYQQGPEGVRRVRQMVGYAQGEARRLTLRGRHLFDKKGRIEKNAALSILERYRAGGTVRANNSADAQLAALLINASIRPTPTLWQEADVNHRIAEAILTRPEGEHPHIQDAAAAYALHDMAQSQGWSQGQVASLFSDTKEAQVLNQGKHHYGSVAIRLTKHGEWKNESREMRREAARLATLAIGPNIKPTERRSPNPALLARKVANPATEDGVVTTNQGAPGAVNELHELSEAEGWNRAAVTTLFEATRAAQTVERRPSETLSEVAARSLADNEHFDETDETTLRQAARLALQIDFGTRRVPLSATPSVAQRAAARRRELIKENELIKAKKSQANPSASPPPPAPPPSPDYYDDGPPPPPSPDYYDDGPPPPPSPDYDDGPPPPPPPDYDDGPPDYGPPDYEPPPPDYGPLPPDYGPPPPDYGPPDAGPPRPPVAATVRDRLEKQAANTVILQTEASGKQTQAVQQVQQERVSDADRASLLIREQQERQEQERYIDGPPDNGPPPPNYGQSADVEPPPNYGQPPDYGPPDAGPPRPPVAATVRDRLEKQAANTVLLQTEASRKQTQTVQQVQKERVSDADRASLLIREQQERQEQERYIDGPPDNGPPPPNYGQSADVEPPPNYGQPPDVEPLPVSSEPAVPRPPLETREEMKKGKDV